MISRGIVLLLWVFFVHLAGIYLFTRGFLLSRLSLSESASCSTQPCSLPPIHGRAVILIIDALRFDFISPDSPSPASPFHHNVLTLPRELTASRPEHSFLFNAYADPPTTTLQRIKGLTTGSLPTFVDIGNNFGGSSIAEDSIMNQLRRAGKKAAFMGDDTWMSVFPDSFESNMSFPYDSFNVEDLHTVDNGVIKHLFPLLQDKNKTFDFLVGHFLGVDHVGHRVGPDHPSMKAKLQQMNEVLTRVVELLDNDTLLVVLGDHGMDRSGDHGGDGTLETSSALWVYSKGPAISQTTPVPSGLLQYTTFPGMTVPHRLIQQIDILPTLSLLLGLPIPFNNLGIIIPELFQRDRRSDDLTRALELNIAQIKAYLDAYRSSPSGGELDDAWNGLQSAWAATQAVSHIDEANLITLMNYGRVALATCRSLWAQFNPILMSFGLGLLGVGILFTWSVYMGIYKTDEKWDDWINAQLQSGARGVAGGVVLGFLMHLAFGVYLPGISAFDCILFAASLSSCLSLIISSSQTLTFGTLQGLPLILIIHTIAFFSNSFTFWEDRVVPFLIISSIVPYILIGLTAPTTRLRIRILGFSLLFGLCVRLISISTICREEQQPYCHVTYYASSSLPSPPLLVLLIIGPVSLCLPWLMQRFLKITRSDMGVAKSFFPLIMTPSLLAGTAFWMMEWADSSEIVGNDWSSFLRLSRTCIAWFSLLLPLTLGSAFWWMVPLCLEIEMSQPLPGEKRQVKVIGYANAFGSPYLVFWSISLCVVYATTQLTGQLILGFSTIALIAYLEVVDSVRDVKAMNVAFTLSKPSAVLDLSEASGQSPPIQFADIVPVALLGLHAFYSTGHQSTISSIQWKSAFLLTSTVTYPWAPITVVLNSFGPLFAIGLATPLIALWNRAPLPLNRNVRALKPDTQARKESILAALGMMMYYTTLLLGTAISAAILRRHLMVWKVFAPRFMAGVVGVLTVDVAVLIGFAVGVERIGGKISRMFGGTPP